MIDVLHAFPEQCKDAVKLARGFKTKKNPKNIIFCGMGGSGVAGDIASLFVTKVPSASVHDYHLPVDTNQKSLVFIISYSGNTEEALSCYKEAKRKKCDIIAVTSGGKLAELHKKTVIVPSGYQPRNALGFLLMPLLSILTSNKLIANPSIPEAIKTLTPKTLSREGFLLAKQINGTIPVFYTSEQFRFAAYRCKTQINENAKQPAFYNILPECNHNELSGFKKHAKKLHVVFIRDKKEGARIKKRMDITKKIVKEKAGASEIHTHGSSFLARMLSAIAIGDFASYYLALMNKEDPTPVLVIEDFKKRLAK